MNNLDNLIEKAKKGYENLTNGELIELYMVVIELNRAELKSMFGIRGLLVIPDIINEADRRGVTLKS